MAAELTDLNAAFEFNMQRASTKYTVMPGPNGNLSSVKGLATEDITAALVPLIEKRVHDHYDNFEREMMAVRDY